MPSPNEYESIKKNAVCGWITAKVKIAPKMAPTHGVQPTPKAAPNTKEVIYFDLNFFFTFILCSLSKNLILINLEYHIIEQGLQLQSLQQEEKGVAALLEKLGKAGDTVIFFEDIPSFNSQKGKLKWPIKGKIMNRFGTKRKGGALKWQGVRIRAEQGSEVRAISTGKVIFADWFRNMGLLMILDHGEGYMSLYGYNQSLLKKSGDWVVEDEVIAYAGDSGGQSTPSVYFEIRHRGEPLNPILWCKK